MTGGQLPIAGIDPLTCEHAGPHQLDGHVYCTLHDAWVECQTGHFGEPPMCAWDEPDNSEAAMAARLAWVRANK